VTARPRLLLVTGRMAPPGGGESVSAWALQVLRERFAVSVLSFERPDTEALNRWFGTSLRSSDFAWVPAATRTAALLRRIPIRVAYARLGLLQRVARGHVMRDRPDVVISFANEMDLGPPALQYVHYPALREPRPDAFRWFHLRPLVWAYRRGVERLLPLSRERVRANTALANSSYVAEIYERLHGVRPPVLHPPVPGGFDPVPWDARETAFACAGRLSPEKRLETVIAVLAAVRRRGHALRLDLFGARDHRAYARRLAPLLREHRDWVTLREGVSREAYTRELPRHRFGIHGMEGEHFGIGVAEMQRAGCVVFAPKAGGPAEILGGDARLLYGSPAEAEAKIARVLEDPGLQRQLHAEAAERAQRFGVERFAEELLAHAEAMRARSAGRTR